MHFDVLKHTKITSMGVMVVAGKKEAELAIKEGNIDENDVPLITVIADGARSKKSYKRGCNALSGIVSILLKKDIIL